LSNREQEEEEEGSALTPETFLLQATRSKTLEVNRNTGMYSKRRSGTRMEHCS
jgi:hypothetical protein